jgi:hypothetical protein
MHKMSAVLLSPLGFLLAHATLAAAHAGGATFKDVVKTTTYVVNYQPAMRDGGHSLSAPGIARVCRFRQSPQS